MERYVKTRRGCYVGGKQDEVKKWVGGERKWKENRLWSEFGTLKFDISVIELY